VKYCSQKLSSTEKFGRLSSWERVETRGSARGELASDSSAGHGDTPERIRGRGYAAGKRVRGRERGERKDRVHAHAVYPLSAVICRLIARSPLGPSTRRR